MVRLCLNSLSLLCLEAVQKYNVHCAYLCIFGVACIMVDSTSLTYPRPYTCMQYWNATEDKSKYNEQNSKKIHLSVTVTVSLDVSRSCRLGGCLLETLNLSRNLTNVLVYSCITCCKCKNASVFCCLKSGGALLQSEKLNPDFFFLIHTNICKTFVDTQPTSPPRHPQNAN